MKKKINLLIFWEGLPACSLLLKELLKAKENFSLTILATKAAVPFEGLEELMGHGIVYLDNPNQIWEEKDKYSNQDIVIHTGWRYKGWLKFDKWIKEKNGAKVVVVVDNSFKFDLRQVVGALYYRLFLRNIFDGCFVPGREGQKLMNFLGHPKKHIYTGNYGAYSKIYHDTRPINERKNEFLYVGSLNTRKSIDLLTEAFQRYKEMGGKWDLRILGDGELKYLAEDCGAIVEGFKQPNEVASRMNEAKVFILASRMDHWGTVVCEAAACGMLLMTSPKVGSSVDIIRQGVNGIELDTLSAEAIVKAMFYFEQQSDESLDLGSDVSKKIAHGYNEHTYFSAVKLMCYDFGIKNENNF